jgi:putative peptidoglycan lipid II flippase
MGILNACGRFALPALSSSMFNVGSLCFGLLIGRVFGPQIGITPIEGMAWGVICGGALQLLAQVPSLYREGFIFRPTFNFDHPGLIHIAKLMGPAILGNAAVQINVMVNSNFASQINDPVTGFNGPVTWLGCAFRFMQLPLGLFGVAIGGATLPAISRAAANGDMDDFRRTLSRSSASFSCSPSPVPPASSSSVTPSSDLSLKVASSTPTTRSKPPPPSPGSPPAWSATPP